MRLQLPIASIRQPSSGTTFYKRLDERLRAMAQRSGRDHHHQSADGRRQPAAARRRGPDADRGEQPPTVTR